MNRRYRRKTKDTYSVPQRLVKDTRVMTSLTFLARAGSEWWNSLRDEDVLPMKVMTRSISSEATAAVLPIGCAQAISLRADDLLRYSRWSSAGKITYFSKMFPRVLSFRIKNVAPVGQRGGVITATFYPLTQIESLSGDLQPVRKDDAPVFEFDELIRLSGAKTVSADQQISFNYIIPEHSWMREGVMIGAPIGSGDTGSPLGRLYVGYRDLAKDQADRTGLYGPSVCCLAVDITAECSFGGFGVRSIDGRFKTIYPTNVYGVVKGLSRVDFPCDAFASHGCELHVRPEWAGRFDRAIATRSLVDGGESSSA